LNFINIKLQWRLLMRSYFALLGAAIMIAGSAAADALAIQQVDPTAGFNDVTRAYPDMDERYVRLGESKSPRQIQRIALGQSKRQLTAILGNPVSADQFGRWNFEVNLPLTRKDELVCQLKVSFDENDLVSGVTWRRSQCADTAARLTRR
jgi:outer membrane protein assembly factor BamE (lipoprotein component of BamABCDE complex)